MVENHSSLDDILQKYARGEKLTDPETDLLNQSIRALPPVPMAEIWSDIQRRIKADAGPPAASVRRLLPGRQYFTATAWYLGAAAVVILVFAWILRYNLHNENKKPETRIAPAVTVKVPEKPLLPPSKQAVLTLADNSRISLDTIPVGTTIRVSEDLSLKKVSTDQLVYTKIDGSGSGFTEWNRLIVGTQHQAIAFMLPDGSRVHLKPGSTMRYPVMRDGQALVDLEGEAWFAVVPNSRLRLAILGPGGLEAQVLGTTFAMQAHIGDSEPRVWLISGAVKVLANGQSRLLRSGGAIAMKKGRLTEESLNTGTALFAWSGVPTEMHFNRMAFGAAIEEIAASYGLKVENPESVQGIPVTGTFFRDQPPEKTLKELEGLESGTAFFSIKGNRIIISGTSETK